jgi:hypothetical protein
VPHCSMCVGLLCVISFSLSRPLLGNRFIVDRRSTDLELWLVP